MLGYHPLVAVALLALMVAAVVLVWWRIDTPAARSRRGMRERQARAEDARKH